MPAAARRALRPGVEWEFDKLILSREFSRNVVTRLLVERAEHGGWELDRVRFRVAGGTYRAADLAHWLALDVASQALEDAGFPDARGLSRDTFGVLVGNSLTYVNNLPALLRALGESQGMAITTETYAEPGGTLAERWREGHVAEGLPEGQAVIGW